MYWSSKGVWCAAIGLVLWSATVSAAVEWEGATVEHSVDSVTWSAIGHLTAIGLETPNGTGTVSLTTAETSALAAAAATDAFYRIRVTPVQSGRGRVVQSAAPACAVAAAAGGGLRLHVTPHSQALVALSFITTGGGCAPLVPQPQPSPPPLSLTLNVSIEVAHDSGAPLAHEEVPPPPENSPTDTVVQSTGFFQKYWLYIAGGLLVLNVLLGLAAGPAPQQSR